MIHTYGMQFDSCGSDIDTPYLSDNAVHLSSFDPQARWVSGHGSENDDFLYRAGDVVLFSKFTIHGSLQNGSQDYVRLSSDIRFQPVSDPVDYRHSTTPGRQMMDPSQDEAYMRETHERFDRLKASTYEGPTRTMAEALAEWGVTPKALL
jgi:ectoine hydroxylase-related dioxygenase (phytanoyl-CoA dioxygenase family)